MNMKKKKHIYKIPTKPKYMPADPYGAQSVAHEPTGIAKEFIKHLDKVVEQCNNKKIPKYRPRVHW